VTVSVLIAAALLLAGANGANDNFKGVATLYGSGVLRYRQALLLGTVATLIGSLTALGLGSALIVTFSGKGLVADAVAAEPRFMGAVGLGAGATVLLATRLGLPVSTTHALVGALAGASFAYTGPAVDFARLWAFFALPLLSSPIIASAMTALQYRTLRAARALVRVEADTCLCLEDTSLAPAPSGTLAAAVALPAVTLCEADGNRGGMKARIIGLRADTALAVGHCLSAAVVSFARGVNDTPKIAVLLLATRLLPSADAFAIVAAAMALGGVSAARRVAETMSHNITTMSPGQAFAGNLTTALLVLGASRFGLPVSTTDVTCGALFGIGLTTRRARWNTIAGILMAWLTTVPLAAVIGGLVAAWA
jgi:PiT family inorganic phosphate transporter